MLVHKNRKKRAWPQGTKTIFAFTLLQQISHKLSITVEAESTASIAEIAILLAHSIYIIVQSQYNMLVKSASILLVVVLFN